MKKPRRKSIGKQQRFEIFKRDGFQCVYCGQTPPQVVLECDHVVAVSKGGTNDAENLVTSCFDCNRGKSDIPLTQVPASVEAEMHERRERAEQLQAYNEFQVQYRESLRKHAETVGIYWNDCVYGDSNRYTFGPQRMASTLRFLRDLPVSEVLEAADIAISKIDPSTSEWHNDQAFKYFCGICWNKIEDRSE